ncbi:transaldolase family protein [Aurantiacibacter spongiae]|uniref:Transaldolase n=1 Tax=Aurantiacibacter spongiae TaxID=2488860 RepID=A0A3N5DR80_9SPHN|nr:transaldolase family protein [Aurantiacibacter spongiae]RPF71661.1 hypothetical protein EG799_08530 [Aurantiacibacter spongiae]
MTTHVLQRLARTNPDCEIWWDSSPLVFPSWRAETLAAAPEGKRGDWEEQLDWFYDQKAIDEKGTMGFRGVTTNPPLVLQTVQVDPPRWQARIHDIMKSDRALDVEAVYWQLYLDIVKAGAEAIRPVYDASGGQYGFLSGQVDPRFAEDGERMLREGLQIAAQGPNVMVKIPGSKAGYEVIEELTARGIATNNTSSFAVPQYMRCMAAVTAGLQRARAASVDLSNWRSIVTHMASRLSQKGDWATEAKARGIDLSTKEMRDGEEAVLKRAYWWAKDNDHPSKMLQCSLRIEQHESGQWVSRQIEDFAGSGMVYTCPPSYIARLMELENDFRPLDPDAIRREPDAESLEKLLRLPSFRAAYEFDGMTPDQFSQFGSFQATGTEFATATRATVDFVRAAMEG